MRTVPARKENDGNETSAIKEVFGDLRCEDVPVSSIKSMMGHLIAAAGAVEMICCVLALRDQMLPPTMNFENLDPECDLDYVPNKARAAKVDVALSNSFGFGRAKRHDHLEAIRGVTMNSRRARSRRRRPGCLAHSHNSARDIRVVACGSKPGV